MEQLKNIEPIYVRYFYVRNEMCSGKVAFFRKKEKNKNASKKENYIKC